MKSPLRIHESSEKGEQVCLQRRARKLTMTDRPALKRSAFLFYGSAPLQSINTD